MPRTIITFTLLVFSIAAAPAGQDASCMLRAPGHELAPPTGVLIVDLRPPSDEVFASPSMQDSAITHIPGAKSPWLAAGLSAVLPGSGEFYAESYFKSAAFFAVEVAVWVVAYTYDKKADRQTDFFQDYANAHWSVVAYGNYATETFFPSGSTYLWLKPGTDGLPPWQRVNWGELNRMERDIAATDAGRYYSHVLPPYGEQQYYELIGKYPQFNQGWDDAPPSFNYGDPLTARFEYYSAERGKANDYYNTASTMVAIAVVNHVVSMIDAAFTTAGYNRRLRAEAGSMTLPVPGGVQSVPSMTLRYGW
jgi:hypothetical protein